MKTYNLYGNIVYVEECGWRDASLRNVISILFVLLSHVSCVHWFSYDEFTRSCSCFFNVMMSFRVWVSFVLSSSCMFLMLYMCVCSVYEPIVCLDDPLTVCFVLLYEGYMSLVRNSCLLPMQTLHFVQRRLTVHFFVIGNS